jgi:hypothetical protein
LGRHVFQAMDNEIQAAFEQASFELVGPEGFSAEVVQWGDLVLVAHGAHGVDCEGAGWVRGLEGAVDDVSLEEGEGGFTGADVNCGAARGGFGLCFEDCGGSDIFGRCALDRGCGV